MAFLSVCTALYDYIPQGEGELPLKEGELVYILEKSEEDDWWKAKKRAPSDEEEEPVGLIPNNYVEEARPTHHAKALYDYSRQTDEELSFSEDAALAVYDNRSDPEWTLVGLDGEYGFVPANYIEITSEAEQGPRSPALSDPLSPPGGEVPQQIHQSHAQAAPTGSAAAAIAGIMQGRTPSAASAATPSLPQRQPQLTPQASDDEEPPPPSLPQRPQSQQLSPPPTQVASPQLPESPTGIAASPPYNRAVHQTHDQEPPVPSPGGFHLYNISEMVSTMGRQKRLPTTLGLNIATGKIMIAPEKSRDGPTLEWTAEKLTHYSIEGKHVFLDLVRPSKSIDFHAGAKDTAQEIVRGLGEIAGASRAEGLREVLEAAGTGIQRKGKMLYDFVAQGDDEVTVGVDDEVMIIDDTKSDEWWMVRRVKNGKEGVVPSSYVELNATVAPPARKSDIHSGRSVVEQNRLEEERLTKEAMKASQGSEVGPGITPPERGSSLTGGDGNKASQRSKKESKHGRSASSSKPKPDTSKVRTWTDRSGNFKVEAQFLGLKDGKIHLHKLNGVKIAVPAGKMAIEDLEYVEAATGRSLDDEKPLSEIKRRSTQKAAASPKSGASFEKPKPPPKEESEYDWFDFFLKCGVPYQLCERYAYNFKKDSMDENILPDITPSVLRTLGLKEGDILRVTKYLDTKYNRKPTDRGDLPDPNAGGLFSGPGGTLRNNTRKGRPAPAVESKAIIDEAAFKAKENGHLDAAGPPPPSKDRPGFDDDAWDVKPSKQSAPSKSTAAPPASEGAASPSAPTNQLSANLLDLSALSTPLQPTPAPQTQQDKTQPPQQPPQAHQQQEQQQASPQSQPAGANSQFFSQLGPSTVGGQLQQENTVKGQSYQAQQQPQQTGPPRQRPQAPPATQQASLIPPPPTRPLSAPQTQPQQNSFGPPPLQPQLTGYQPHTQIAPPGQSLNELNQQRFQQPQYNQQPQQFGQQPLLPLQTGFMPQNQNFGQMQSSMMPQPSGFAPQNPYINGQLAGSPFADPRMHQQQTGFQPIQSQQTAFQPLQPQQTGFQHFQSAMQPQQTGINSMLPPALQPQPTGVNGYQRPAFGQSPPPIPSVPPMPQQPAAAPLQPQKTGPAPPVRFGTLAANKLTPQATGRKANLRNATPSNPFGF